MGFVAAVGLILVLISLVMPWADTSVTIAGILRTDQQIRGIQVAHGWIATALSLIATVIGFSSDSEKSGGVANVAAGVLVVVITASAILSDGGGVFGSSGPITIEANATMRAGVYVALVGGIIMTLGGFGGLAADD